MGQDGMGHLHWGGIKTRFFKHTAECSSQMGHHPPSLCTSTQFVCPFQISFTNSLYILLCAPTSPSKSLHIKTLSIPMGCEFFLILVPSWKFKGPANWQHSPITSVLWLTSVSLDFRHNVITCKAVLFGILLSQTVFSVWNKCREKIILCCNKLLFSFLRESNQSGSHTFLLW